MKKILDLEFVPNAKMWLDFGKGQEECGFGQVGKCILPIIGKWHRIVEDCTFRKKTLEHFWSMYSSRNCHSSINMRILFPFHLKLSRLFQCIGQQIISIVMPPSFWLQDIKADMASAWISHLGCLNSNFLWWGSPCHAIWQPAWTSTYIKWTNLQMILDWHWMEQKASSLCWALPKCRLVN